MSLIKNAKASLSPGGRNGLSSKESRDPIGYAVAALNSLAQNPLIDRLGIRKQTEQVVFTTTRGGFRVMGAASRTFSRKGKPSAEGVRVPSADPKGVFDLTPTEDEQMLVDVVTELAAEVLRPAAADADTACAAPEEVLSAGQ